MFVHAPYRRDALNYWFDRQREGGTETGNAIIAVTMATSSFMTFLSYAENWKVTLPAVTGILRALFGNGKRYYGCCLPTVVSEHDSPAAHC